VGVNERDGLVVAVLGCWEATLGDDDRDALDLLLDGESLSEELDVAPYSADEIANLDLMRRWVKPGSAVPVFNCLCGIPECGGIDADVTVSGNTIQWRLSRSGRRVQFDRQSFYDTVSTALRAR
jgi:hypothetical protein